MSQVIHMLAPTFASGKLLEVNTEDTHDEQLLSKKQWHRVVRITYEGKQAVLEEPRVRGYQFDELDVIVFEFVGRDINTQNHLHISITHRPWRGDRYGR